MYMYMYFLMNIIFDIGTLIEALPFLAPSHISKHLKYTNTIR